MNLDFSNVNILVVGDVMLDSYWQGKTERISPEAPVPVVHVNDRSWRVGGSGNVAVNVTSLGANARLLAMMGDDSDGQRLAELLSQSDIENHCLIDHKIPTTNKLRVLSQHQQLIRLDFEQVLIELDIQPMLDIYDSLVEKSSVVVLSDYGKGLLKQTLPFILRANKSNVPVLIDPKKNSFEDYKGAYLLTPNQKEMEIVVGKWSDQADLINRSQQVIGECDPSGLLVTQGGDGMTLIMKGQTAEYFPAHAQEVYDVTGAGDTVIATLATGLGSGMSIQDSVFLSCKAAGIVVGRVGTASVSVEDLENLERSSSNKLSPIQQKIVDKKDISSTVDFYKKQGKKIVFTNGCFDLLHAGHVRYLEKASALGDVLIVAVNSDDSVTQLKGKSRPINPLQDRMELLAGLASVDLVIDFTEDTPENLICSIKPDILVKGGDYKVDEIAGRQCVEEVILIDFVTGKSTSSMVKKIRALSVD